MQRCSSFIEYLTLIIRFLSQRISHIVSIVRVVRRVNPEIIISIGRWVAATSRLLRNKSGAYVSLLPRAHDCSVEFAGEKTSKRAGKLRFFVRAERRTGQSWTRETSRRKPKLLIAPRRIDIPYRYPTVFSSQCFQTPALCRFNHKNVKSAY